MDFRDHLPFYGRVSVSPLLEKMDHLHITSSIVQQLHGNGIVLFDAHAHSETSDAHMHPENNITNKIELKYSINLSSELTLTMLSSY